MKLNNNTLCIPFSVFYLLAVAYAYKVPLYNWPLIPGNQGLEIVNNWYTGISGCGGSFQNSTKHPELNYASTKFLGTSTSRMDLYVPLPADTLSDFGLTLSFKPATTAQGTLFHYKTDASVSVSDFQITEIRLYFDRPKMYLEVYNNSHLYQKKTVDSGLETDSWFDIGVFSDVSKKTVSLIHDEDMTSTSVGDDQFTLALPGTLRLGGGFDDVLPPFRGIMTCVHMYKNKLARDEFEESYLQCLKSKWPAVQNVSGK